MLIIQCHEGLHAHALWYELPDGRVETKPINYWQAKLVHRILAEEPYRLPQVGLDWMVSDHHAQKKLQDELGWAMAPAGFEAEPSGRLPRRVAGLVTFHKPRSCPSFSTVFVVWGSKPALSCVVLAPHLVIARQSDATYFHELPNCGFAHGWQALVSVTPELADGYEAFVRTDPSVRGCERLQGEQLEALAA